jgi:hypothetical protein
MKRWFHRLVLSRRPVTFVVMGLAFFVFGAGTLNLFRLLQANLGLIGEHGLMALRDGAAQQLLELLITGYGALGAYVVFKTCEHALVHDLAGAPLHAPEP